MEDLEQSQRKIKESLKETIDAITKFRNVIIGQETNPLVPVIKDLLFCLSLDKIDRDAVINNISKWGEYGWAVMDFASLDLYSRLPPSSCSEADRIAMRYCTDCEMQNLIAEIKNTVVWKKDFDDAIYCYSNSRWKPCAMILLGIIDAMLIKFQPVAIGSSSWRKVGEKAAKKVKDKIEEKNNQTPKMLTYAFHLSTIKAIEQIFIKGDDFTNENPDIISRSFVLHGMSQREVTKTDCIKLLLILDDLIRIYDFYGFKFQS